MSEQDTICAISTPLGEGGIGIIRLSGKDAVAVAQKVFRPRRKSALDTRASHYIRYGHVVDPDTGEVVDEVLVTVMRGPATYTREDVVEINCHAGPMALRKTLGLLIKSGARQAEPGEFTKRAFLNGRIDLTQAEAVMDLIHAKTELSLRAANEQLNGGLSVEIGRIRERLISLVASVEAGIDFPEEDIETMPDKSAADDLEGLIGEIDRLVSGFEYGRVMREGIAAAIVGRPNVGKSSLLNALLEQDRAIVTEIPGTTRDVIEEYLNISGAAIRIIDTAGIRSTADIVEREGVRRSLAAAKNADMVLLVLDGSEPLHDGDRAILAETRGKSVISVINKSDLPRRMEPLDEQMPQVRVSCLTGSGIAELKRTIFGVIEQGCVFSSGHAWAVNQRHKAALEQARGFLERARESLFSGMSPEFASVDMRDALDCLGIVIGATYTEDILDRIFGSFCIGK